MENVKSPQQNRRGHALEMAKIARVTTSLRQLRHLGFHRMDLPTDSEFVSEGPSQFHEVGYCSSGEVLVLVGHGFERVETFTVRQGDVFFLPAGSAFSIHNTATGHSGLIVAIARDGVDQTELPLVEGGRVVVVEGTDKDHRAPRTTSMSGEDEGYEILYRDLTDSGEDEQTVAGIFNKAILAREFGVAEAQLPDMNFGLYDPLVVRPLGADCQRDDDFAAFCLD